MAYTWLVFVGEWDHLTSNTYPDGYFIFTQGVICDSGNILEVGCEWPLERGGWRCTFKVMGRLAHYSLFVLEGRREKGTRFGLV